MDLGHERRRLLVADQDVANGGPGERIGEVDVLFPGDAEHTGDTLVLEALDEEFGGTPSSFSHGRSVRESRPPCDLARRAGRSQKVQPTTRGTAPLSVPTTGNQSSWTRRSTNPPVLADDAGRTGDGPDTAR